MLTGNAGTGVVVVSCVNGSTFFERAKKVAKKLAATRGADTAPVQTDWRPDTTRTASNASRVLTAVWPTSLSAKCTVADELNV